MIVIGKDRNFSLEIALFSKIAGPTSLVDMTIESKHRKLKIPFYLGDHDCFARLPNF